MPSITGTAGTALAPFDPRHGGLLTEDRTGEAVVGEQGAQQRHSQRGDQGEIPRSELRLRKSTKDTHRLKSKLCLQTLYVLLLKLNTSGKLSVFSPHHQNLTPSLHSFDSSPARGLTNIPGTTCKCVLPCVCVESAFTTRPRPARHSSPACHLSRLLAYWTSRR